MSKVLINENTLKDMADSIRAKTGSTEKLKPSDMVTDINSLYIGSDTRDANATAKDIELGKTAYVNEVKLTGTHNIEKDLNTNIFKTFTINLDQTNLVNYYLEELSKGTLLTANLYGFIGHLKEYNNNLMPKDFTMISPNTAPYLILLQAGDDTYIYFDSNYTLGFTQFDSMAGTGFVSAFLSQTGMTQAQLNSLSGWFNANTLQPVVNPIVVNDLLIEEAFTSTVGDFVQNGQNFHYTNMQINLDDSLYNISYTKYDGITEAQDIRSTFSRIVSNSYLSNATATAEDIAQGKIAFIQGGKVTGTASGGGGDYNTAIDLDVTKSGSSDLLKQCITEINMTNGFDLSKFSTAGGLFDNCRNLEKIPLIVNTSSTTTFSQMFQNCVKLKQVNTFDTSSGQYFADMFQYCENLESAPNFQTSNGLNFARMYSYCSKIKTAPQYNTAKAASLMGMFQYCSELQDVPVYSFASISVYYNIQYIFLSCPKLTNESLNNILASCPTATNLSSGKTLKNLGLSRTQCTTCTGLSNWSACEAAGWTTGF